MAHNIQENNDSYVRETIESFLPAAIGDSFEVVKYSYRAEDTDTYGFEECEEW